MGVSIALKFLRRKSQLGPELTQEFTAIADDAVLAFRHALQQARRLDREHPQGQYAKRLLSMINKEFSATLQQKYPQIGTSTSAVPRSPIHTAQRSQ